MRMRLPAAVCGPDCSNKMELPISMQLQEAAASLLFGAVLGLVYDLMRAVRIKAGGPAVHILDILYCAFAAMAMFTLGIASGEGRLRVFMAIIAAAGAGLYFISFGRLVFPAACYLVGLISRLIVFCLIPIKLLSKPLKKCLFFFKNIFQNVKRWFTIILNYPRAQKLSGGDGHSAEAATYETEAGKYFY